MKRILVLALLLSNIIFAANFDVPMKITLKDNTYNLKSSCSYNIVNDGYLSEPYWNKKKYEFIFESKYHIFENYRECKPNCVNPPLIPKSLRIF